MTLLGTAATATGLSIWLFLCAWIYHLFRRAAWLAGSSVSCCLFFVGATVAAGCFVPRALYLSPLALAVIVVLAVHLRAAQVESFPRELPGSNQSPPGRPFDHLSVTGPGPPI